MKTIAYFLLFSALILGSFIACAQKQITPIPSNPRVSSNPIYVKDTVTTQNKLVTPKDTVKEDPNKPLQGGVFALSGVLGFPQNDFGSYTHNTIGYGLDITLLFNLLGKRSRAEWEQRFVNVYAGGNFQFMRQDGTRDSYTFEDSYTITTVTSKVRNNMSGIGLLTRVEFFPGMLKLFVEGGVGTRVFNGKHQIEVENRPQVYTNPDDVRTTTTNRNLRSALIGNYSYGGGLRVCPKDVGIEFKIMSVQGSTAEYVDVKSIQFNRTNNTVDYKTKQSQTDMIIFQLGISGRF